MAKDDINIINNNNNQVVVKVKRDRVAACMTCPLCHKLLNEATTISLCLHTFCRKCIYDKLADEESDCCPVCDINLGCVPVDKLRPDHNLQDIRAKIFPYRKKVEALEIAPSISPPTSTKRKERSLSSLVVSTPRVSSQGGVTGRRTRAGVRKSSANAVASPATEGTPKKEDSMDDRVDGSSSPETLNKIIQNKKQGPWAKSSNDTENNNEGREGKVDLWKPLNTLLEAANRSKYPKSAPHVKSDPSTSGDADVNKNKTEENGQRAEVQDAKGVTSVPGPGKRKRLRQSNKNHLSGSAESSNSQLALTAARRNWKDGPIWFSLVPSGDQEGVEPLPQISAAFLRVKDGSMTISSIQKYIVKKLDLQSEAEVQILCQGQPIVPDLKLNSLVDLWLHSASNQKKIRTAVGESAKEFVMVLAYSRRLAVPSS